MTDDKDIPWKRLTAEGAAIVVSILLAFAIDAWWDDRIERNTAREYADNLLVEVRANINDLEEHVKRHNDKVVAGAELLRLMKNDDLGPSDERTRALVTSMVFIDDFRPATSALDNLLGAGGLGLLENTKLQLAVSQYGQSIYNHNTLQDELLEFFFGVFIPFLSERISLLDVDFVHQELSDQLPNSSFQFEPSALANSMQFENLVARRVNAEYDAARFAQRLIESANALVVQLEKMESGGFLQ
ncbi:MAG: hypothetical protein AAF351_01065 [Pseudomonadota bacterium]